MKRFNMTQLARQAKSVVADAMDGPVLIITPSKIEDVVVMSESKYNALNTLIDQLSTIGDGLLDGKTLAEITEEHLAKQKAQ